VTKPLAWKSRTDINVKNLFELKNAQRITVDGNVFENNWLAAQSGYSILLTGRSQDGFAPWSIVQDFSFTNNIVRHVASGINILGHDYRFPSGTSNGLVFRNNLFDDVSGTTFGGDGRFMLINGGLNVTVDHNTIIQDGYSVLYGRHEPGAAVHDDQQHRPGQLLGHHGRRHRSRQWNDRGLLSQLDASARRLGSSTILVISERELLPVELVGRGLRQSRRRRLSPGVDKLLPERRT
jgi:hypothetical protein